MQFQDLICTQIVHTLDLCSFRISDLLAIKNKSCSACLAQQRQHHLELNSTASYRAVLPRCHQPARHVLHRHKGTVPAPWFRAAPAIRVGVDVSAETEGRRGQEGRTERGGREGQGEGVSAGREMGETERDRGKQRRESETRGGEGRGDREGVGWGAWERTRVERVFELEEDRLPLVRRCCEEDLAEEDAGGLHGSASAVSELEVDCVLLDLDQQQRDLPQRCLHDRRLGALQSRRDERHGHGHCTTELCSSRSRMMESRHRDRTAKVLLQA